MINDCQCNPGHFSKTAVVVSLQKINLCLILLKNFSAEVLQ